MNALEHGAADPQDQVPSVRRPVMGKVRTLVVAGCVALLWVVGPSVVRAWDEPTGFRDIPWGSSQETVRAQLPSLQCNERGCSGNLSIGEVRAYTAIRFSKSDGGMDTVVLLFPSKDFYQMKQAFLARYGEPTKRETPIFQNRMGARFENERLEWEGETVFIRLSQYASKLTDGSAIIQTAEARRRGFEEFREKAKSGKKDL
jgi:hypothetical protein